MRERNLVIRRFGVLSFGIGYYENGAWVDHAAGDAVTDGQLDAVHAWFGCCPPTADARPEADGITVLRRIAVEPWEAEGAPSGDAVLAN
jgi:hypothetical protein